MPALQKVYQDKLSIGGIDIAGLVNNHHPLVEDQNIVREVESEGDALSMSKDFFKLQDQMNKSIRSKATYFCLSQKDDCNRLCQH